MPQISVIIPVYNGEKTIRETIESVLNQTFSDFELIVINDGSHDSTIDILDSIQDSRLKVHSYANAGASASRNRGIAYARGEYIAFIDADDIWTPDKLEAQLNALEANPEVAVAYSWTDHIDETGQYLFPGGRTLANGDVFATLLVYNFMESGSNPLICEKALHEVGEFDTTINNVEDWDMWLRLAARYHFVGVPRPQILYHHVGSSISRNVLKQEEESIKLLNRIYAQFPAFQHLKGHSLANLYTYLSSKALEGPPMRQNGMLAAKYLWNAVRSESSILCQTNYILTLLFKIVTAILLPSQQAQMLRKRIKALIQES